MFPFLRFSAVTASVIVASTAFGFSLATMILSLEERAENTVSNGPGLSSPGSASRGNVESGTRSSRQVVAFKSRSIALLDASVMINTPAVNPQGPMPGIQHANMGRTRAIVSACLMAMN